MGWTKLSTQIITSTIWCEDDKTLRVWVGMLALADADGVVEGTVPGLANVLKVDVPTLEACLDKFQKPDRFSRSRENEGRRIEPIDGGWLLLNHAKYRAERDKELRKEQVKEAVARHRAKHPKQAKNAGDVIKCNQSKPSPSASASVSVSDGEGGAGEGEADQVVEEAVAHKFAQLSVTGLSWCREQISGALARSGKTPSEFFGWLEKNADRVKGQPSQTVCSMFAPVNGTVIETVPRRGSDDPAPSPGRVSQQQRIKNEQIKATIEAERKASEEAQRLFAALAQAKRAPYYEAARRRIEALPAVARPVIGPATAAMIEKIAAEEFAMISKGTKA